jgi:hypothetical protein
VYRAKFTLGKGNRNKLFEELGTLNSRLEKLVQQHDVVSRLKEERDTERQIATSLLGPKANSFWQSADRLYRSLAGAWQCNCFHHHCAKLMLQHRRNLEIDFVVVFQFQATVDSLGISSHFWQLQETNVKGSEEIKNSFTIQTSVGGTTQPQHRTAAPLKTSLRLPRAKRRARVQMINTTRFLTTHLVLQHVLIFTVGSFSVHRTLKHRLQHKR